MQAEEEVKFPPYIDISDNAKDFILKTLNKDPSSRCSLIDLFYHPFLR
jgi:serine/threonine protein kinase